MGEVEAPADSELNFGGQGEKRKKTLVHRVSEQLNSFMEKNKNCSLDCLQRGTVRPYFRATRFVYGVFPLSSSMTVDCHDSH